MSKTASKASLAVILLWSGIGAACVANWLSPSARGIRARIWIADQARRRLADQSGRAYF